MTWTFETKGPPVAKARPRYNTKTGQWYTPTRTVRHEAAVYYSMRAAGVKLEPGRMYTVALQFHLSALRSDVDNLAKCCLDGMFPRVAGEADDKQVTQLNISVTSVQDASEEKTVVTITDRGPLHEWMTHE